MEMGMSWMRHGSPQYSYLKGLKELLSGFTGIFTNPVIDFQGFCTMNYKHTSGNLEISPAALEKFGSGLLLLLL